MNSVLILGNPNSGKSLLFNRLTGLAQKVANFPGVTVEIRSGRGEGGVTFRDFPGLYSMQPLTQDEVVAIRGLRTAVCDPKSAAILYVVDATRLQRSLYFLLQVLSEARAWQRPVIVAVNVLDEVVSKGADIDITGLQRELGVPVIGISAKTSLGLKELKAEIARQVAAPRALVESTEAVPQAQLPLETLKERAAFLAKNYGPRADVLLRSQQKLDAFFLSSFWGPLAFFALMLFLFQAIFSWAKPLMDGVQGATDFLGQHVIAVLPPGILADFVKDALIGGVGSFLVFAPQILMLFLIIGILEDSGYLARAAILCHRPLSYFGLSGRSFVPLLSGHACAIPAIMSARTIESPRRRLLTQLAVPFMTCSARLPVYALLVSAFVPARVYLGGLFGLQGVAFFALYVLGISFGLIVSGVLSAALRSRTEDAPFVVELPPYRMPAWRALVKNAYQRMLHFIKQAGGIIFTVTLVIWFLGYFPHGAGHLNDSYMATFGRFIEPVFKPMGMDWKIGVAVLTSFLAREVFVGTLGTLYGLESAKEHMDTLSQNLHAAGMTLTTALALMVFYALAMQCVSTLAVLRSETGSRKIPVAVFVGYSIIAYAAATLTYAVAHALL